MNPFQNIELRVLFVPTQSYALQKKALAYLPPSFLGRKYHLHTIALCVEKTPGDIGIFTISKLCRYPYVSIDIH